MAAKSNRASVGRIQSAPIRAEERVMQENQVVS